MNIEFIELKLRNFLSFGNVTQSIQLNKMPYTLITGINKDKSVDDEGEKNGVGKTSIFQAVHFALFGRAIGNKVTLPNLVNNINKKNMEVVLTFRKDDVFYKIERGRNPTYLRFYKEAEEISDESLGDSRDTQDIIENVIEMSEELFNQTILLSRGIPFFMDQTSANQKLIIEKVLGIDIITKKINSLKELIKQTKSDITNEEFKVTTVNSQNETSRNNYQTQLNSLMVQKNSWESSRKKELEDKTSQLKLFNNIDFNEEFNLIKSWEHYFKDNSENEENKKKLAKLNSDLEWYNKSIKELNDKLKVKETIDIEYNEKAFDENEKIDAEYNRISSEKQTFVNRYKELANGQKQLDAEVNKLEDKKKSYQNNICPTCGQMIDKAVAEKEIQNIDVSVQQFKDASFKIEMEILEVNSKIAELDTKLNDSSAWTKKETQVKDRYDLIKVKSEIDSLKHEIQMTENGIKSLQEQISGITIQDIKKPEKDSVFSTDGYQNSLNLLYEAKAHLESLKKDIENLSKEEKNPYDETISQIQTALSEIKDVDDTELKKLRDDQEHNEILLKLLNSPSSYIRQAILDKSLEFLNQRIKHYLVKLGSQHYVKFNNDMTLDISKDGLEFGYISSGETGRVSMALTFAFRDAYESLSGNSYNLLMIDELIDSSGLDENGKMDLLKCILEDDKRNTFIVSHDPIISSQISNKLTIVKESSFSNIVS